MAKSKNEAKRRSYAKRLAADPLLTLKRALQNKYGITLEQYQDMVTAQKGLCQICKQPCSSGTRLSVDHDHETGAIRGLLCRRCNMALGGFKDDVLLLESAVAYLQRTSLSRTRRRKVQT